MPRCLGMRPGDDDLYLRLPLLRLGAGMRARKRLPRWPRPLELGDFRIASDDSEERMAAWLETSGGTALECCRAPEVRRLRDWCDRWLAAWEAREK